MNRDQQNKFDEQVREQLTDLQPNYLPQSWDKLSDRLTEIPDPAAAADEQLREAFNELSPVYIEDSWETLSKKIDERNNATADGILINRLDKLAAPTYQPSSWARLAARLELIAQRRSCVTALKITEFSLLLSALLLFWNFFPYGGFGPVQEQSIVAENGFPLPLLSTDAYALAKVEDQSTTSGQPVVASQVANEQPRFTTETANPQPVVVISGATNESAITALPTVAHYAILPAKKLAVGVNIETATNPIAGVEFQLNYPKRLPLLAAFSSKAKQVKAEHSLRVFVSPWDFNRVVTPAFSVRQREIERDVRQSYGLSAGFLIDNDHGKNGHSYGLVYGRRSYIPTVFANVEGHDENTRPSPLQPRDTNYSRIIFHTVGLPFSYQRAIIDNGRWRLTASAGVEANIVLSSKFYKSPNFDENINNYLRTSSPLGAGRSDKNQLSSEDLTNPEPGLLQGGSALLNSSLYLTVGFSLERQLSEVTSLFVAPQFSRAVYYRRSTGLGPFDDRIHPNSIRFGARYRLK